MDRAHERHACVAASGGTSGDGGAGRVRCDVCGFGKKHVSETFVQCVQCKLHVHRECYQIPGFDEKLEFTCFACDAVGKTFQAVEVWKAQTADEDSDEDDRQFHGALDKKGNKKSRDNFNTNIVLVKQRTRPRCCTLCSVRDGNHAMHPLFDNHSSRGRRVFKRSGKNKKELLWAHTLCATMLSSHGNY